MNDTRVLSFSAWKNDGRGQRANTAQGETAEEHTVDELLLLADEAHPPTKNYFDWFPCSVLAYLLCPCTGICAMYYAVRANHAKDWERDSDVIKHSNIHAKRLTLVSIFLGVIFLVGIGMVVIAGTEEILESYDSEVYESHQREQNFVYNHKNGNFGDDMENNGEMSNGRQDGINKHKLQRNEWSGKMNQPTGLQDDSSESIDEQNEQSFDRVQNMTKETGDNENSSEDVSSQELPDDYWFGETNDTDHADDNKLKNDDSSSNTNNQGMLNYNWLKKRMTKYHDWLSNMKNQDRKDSDYLENSEEVTTDTDDQLKNTNIENGRSYSWFGNNGNGEKRNDQWPYVMVDGREMGGEDEGRSDEKKLDSVKRQHRLIKQGADHHD